MLISFFVLKLQAAEALTAAMEIAVRTTPVRGSVLVGGTLGQCHLLQGRLASATTVLVEATNIIRAKRLRGFHSSDALNGLAALRLIVAEKASAEERRRRALRNARRACRSAMQSARTVPSAMPEALRLCGTLAWLSGATRVARERWEQSTACSRKYKLPVEEGRTLLEMGSRLRDVALVDRAIDGFTQSGARVYLALGLHARARMASHEGADIGSMLQRYDQAIAALDEVRTDYALGVACRERAHLYKQLGQLDSARADLTKARNCFEAVGAASEQAEMEHEASAVSIS